ncbi:unnamed protein product [Didymodactylos carnosus]|uniref:Uncharacterized protein n=1 Tax=Didymodactylos carnosus TaxID=1234261 RepID=A0A814WSQ1_9BILA|nr:unnamed protein product [Didymodactylos carnosus]CAF3969995.1 unnamed protein product [Didymodactylos carnosus]
MKGRYAPNLIEKSSGYSKHYSDWFQLLLKRKKQESSCDYDTLNIAQKKSFRMTYDSSAELLADVRDILLVYIYVSDSYFCLL